MDEVRTLGEAVEELISAGVAGIHIQSAEPEEAIAEIKKVCCKKRHTLAVFSLHGGLRQYVQVKAGDSWRPMSKYFVPIGGGAGAQETRWEEKNEPCTAISDALISLQGMTANQLVLDDNGCDDRPRAVLIIQNSQMVLNTVNVVQQVQDLVYAGKDPLNQWHVVLLSPISKIPVELEKSFESGRLEHALPTASQLEEILMTTADQDTIPKDRAKLDKIIEAAGGLTRTGAENAFSLAIVRHNCLDSETIWSMKSKALKATSALTLYRGGDRFSDLGGLTGLKEFCLEMLQSLNSNPELRAKGALLLGVPGTGKSAFAKALGRETGRPTLCMDIGALMGGLVGSTEEATRAALRMIDAMAPCVVFLDEVEKGLSGVSNSGQTDSGVTARIFGAFLTWLNDHTTDVFVVATCNDISKLPPEFSRAGRFDAKFFLDLPNAGQRTIIWDLYLKRYELDATQPRPNDVGWTGAEIRDCCRQAAMRKRSLVKAALTVMPVSKTSSESVQALRKWASGRCLDVETDGIFTFSEGGTSMAVAENGSPRRALRRSVEKGGQNN